MISIGVIGYGYWGPNLVRNFAETPNAKVEMVADRDSKNLEIVQRRYPTMRTCVDSRSLINAPGIDAVAIATPVSMHFELAMAALKAGKHVWVEKPVAETSIQAQMLIDEADKRGLVFMVDHTFIYTGAIRKLSEIIARGELGRIYYFDSIRINLGLFRRDVNVISDLAAHDFSILDHVLGEHPVAVSANGMTHFTGAPENLAYITLFYDSGIMAHVNVNWLAPVKVRQIIVGGSKKMVVYDDIMVSDKIKVYDCGVSFTEDPQQIYELRVGYRTGDMWAPKLDATEALRVATVHFLNCIATATRPLTDGRHGKRVVELIEVATRSLQRNGQPVSLHKADRGV
jgi:predicted dehydrogenase